jgi:hypothetical protein
MIVKFLLASVAFAAIVYFVFFKSYGAICFLKEPAHHVQTR